MDGECDQALGPLSMSTVTTVMTAGTEDNGDIPKAPPRPYQAWSVSSSLDDRGRPAW